MFAKNPNAYIQLADGERFLSHSLNEFSGYMTGELCFNTSMLGYQHSITDPSFANQMLVFSTSHIGNIGINDLDNESINPALKSIIVDEIPTMGFHYQSITDLQAFLSKHNVPILTGLNVRQMIYYIKNHPASNAIIIGNDKFSTMTKSEANTLLVEENKVTGIDMSSQYAIDDVMIYDSYDSKSNLCVAIIDFGIKNGIIRHILKFSKVILIPAKKGMSKIVDDYNVDGIVLSNGPGDPSSTFDFLRDDLSAIINGNKKIFGICLGHQIIGINYGAKTEKMFVGHRGVNHPVYCNETNKLFITSQNHGFAILKDSIDKSLLDITHLSEIDGSIEGIKSKDGRVFSVQFHPEANPGTYDCQYLFEKFKNAISDK